MSPEFCGATVDFSLTNFDGVLMGNQAPLVSVDEEIPGPSNVITYKDYRVLIGNRKWIKEKNFIEIPPSIEEKMLIQEKLGHTALLAAIDGNTELLRNKAKK